MRTNKLTTAIIITLAAFTLTIFAGCSGSSLPKTVEVELPDGTVVDAPIGSGPPSLANTEWSIFRADGSAQGAQFLRLVFDDDGGIESFEDNGIAPEIFGSTILLDGKRHSTPQAGLSYSAGVYGAETDDGTGISFEVRLTGFYSSFKVATGEASAIATFDDDTNTTMRGTFAFSTQLTSLATSFVDIPEANQEDEFDFVGTLIE